MPVAARWHHSAHWVRSNRRRVVLRQEMNREWGGWERTPWGEEGGRSGRNISLGGWHWHLIVAICLPSSVGSDICLLCLSTPLSAPLFPSFSSHQSLLSPLHPCCCQDSPSKWLLSPPLPSFSSSLLLLAVPHSLSSSIKPLTLCGKWAHSPIQYLLRHHGRDFYIKTDKAKGWAADRARVREVTYTQ